MTLPSLPAFFDMPYTDKEGKLTPDSHLYNDQTFQVLNNLVTFFNDFVNTLLADITALQAVGINSPALLGINPPSYTTAQIIAIEPNVNNGTMWFNNNLKKLQFKTDSGVIETITST